MVKETMDERVARIGQAWPMLPREFVEDMAGQEIEQELDDLLFCQSRDHSVKREQSKVTERAVKVGDYVIARLSRSADEFRQGVVVYRSGMMFVVLGEGEVSLCRGDYAATIPDENLWSGARELVDRVRKCCADPDQQHRVTVYVKGGVAGVEADPGVEVEIIDWDSLEEDGYSFAEAPDDYDANGHPGPVLRAWLNNPDPTREGEESST